MKGKMSYLYQVSLVIAMTVLIIGAFPNGVNSRVISREEISKSSYAYNLILSGDHTIYQADNEGVSAVKGNVNIYVSNGYSFTYGAAAVGTSNIVGTAELAANVPALVLGGDFIGSNLDKVIMQGNGFASREGVDPADEVNVNDGAHIELTDSEIAAIFDSLFAESHQRANFWESKVDVPVKANIEFIPSESEERMLVANTTSGELGELYIPNLDNFDYVVIYSSAEEINISGGAINYNGTIVNTSDSKDKALTELAGKIKWVFPNAEKFNMSYFGAIGNYFAPNATVITQGGCINGQLIAHNLIQMDGFEMHNFLPTPVLQKRDESKETEVVLGSEKNEEEVELEKVVTEPEKSTENTEAETTEPEVEPIQESEESVETTEPAAEATQESEESVETTEPAAEVTQESEESVETTELAAKPTQETEESVETTEPAAEVTQESEESVKTTEPAAKPTQETEESLGTTESAAEPTPETEESVETTEPSEATQESEESVKTTESAAETTQESEESVKATEPEAETPQESEEPVETTESETTLASSEEVASELEKPATEKPKDKTSEVLEDDKIKAEAKVELSLETASKEAKSDKDSSGEKTVTANQLSNKTSTDERQTLPRLGSVDTTWLALFGKTLLVLAVCGFVKNKKQRKA